MDLAEWLSMTGGELPAAVVAPQPPPAVVPPRTAAATTALEVREVSGPERGKEGIPTGEKSILPNPNA